MTDLIIVLTTMPDDERANALAKTLVEEKLVACVHVYPAISSTYRWKGTVEVERERPIVIKTSPARLPELDRRLHTLHPYELPELVVLKAEAADAYGRWINDGVGSR